MKLYHIAGTEPLEVRYWLDESWEQYTRPIQRYVESARRQMTCEATELSDPPVPSFGDDPVRSAIGNAFYTLAYLSAFDRAAQRFYLSPIGELDEFAIGELERCQFIADPMPADVFDSHPEWCTHQVTSDRIEAWRREGLPVRNGRIQRWEFWRFCDDHRIWFDFTRIIQSVCYKLHQGTNDLRTFLASSRGGESAEDALARANRNDLIYAGDVATRSYCEAVLAVAQGRLRLIGAPLGIRESMHFSPGPIGQFWADVVRHKCRPQWEIYELLLAGLKRERLAFETDRPVSAEHRPEPDVMPAKPSMPEEKRRPGKDLSREAQAFLTFAKRKSQRGLNMTEKRRAFLQETLTGDVTAKDVDAFRKRLESQGVKEY